MNDLGTALVPLERRKSVFSGEEWTLKKPVDYLTKTVKSEAPPMTESYIAPILPKDGEKEEDEEAPELFEESGEPVSGPVIPAAEETMDQETVKECLKVLHMLYDKF